MPRPRSIGALFVLCAVGLSAPAAVRAQPSLEYAVKAAYLTKFAPFIEWPDGVMVSPSAPVTICILGADPFGALIDRTASSAGRPITIRRIASAGAADGCHLVYAGDAAALDTLSGKPVVTVTDAAADAGIAASAPAAHGVISFVTVDNHVRFDIDDAQAARNGIRISSKLLELAHVVIRRRGA
jgi:hypothetical protein